MPWFWNIAFWLTLAVLVYAQVGYSLTLWLLCRLVRRSKALAAEPANLPMVSLVIPAYNEEQVIEAKLANALALDYPAGRLEVLVASDGSTDRTVELAESFAEGGIRVLAYAERRGKAELLNRAMREVSGDVVFLCDANVMFRPDALRRLVARLEDAQVGAVSGDVRLASHQADFGEGERAYYRVERTVQLCESQIGSMMGVDGGMYVVRLELFQPLPPDTIVEDFVLSMRVIRQGKRVVYEPAAIATENGTPRSAQEFRRRVRLSAGAMQVLKRGEWPPWRRPVEVWQFVSHKLLRWLGPVWLVMLLVSSGMLWNAGPIYSAALLGQLFFYSVSALATAWPWFRETRVGGIAFYFVMSHIAMAVGLMKGLLNQQQVTWTRTERAPLSSEAEAAAVR